MIFRALEDPIKSKLSDKKAIIILGARQVGKTTLLNKLFSKNQNALWLTGDDPDTQTLLQDINLERWKILTAGKSVLIIDEAQRIKNIGIKIKLLIDHLAIKVVLTGSSSLELANEINEPLTGRKWEFKIFPINFSEMAKTKNVIAEYNLLKHRLVFGSYPEVINNLGNEKETLTQICESYLYKDVLTWQNIRKPEKIHLLIKALALQIGNEVSYNELGKKIGLDNQSIENYINLLEKNFIIFRLPSLSRNLRKELTMKRKIYFWDVGIRNAVIAQFQQAEFRQDLSLLFENYFIAERIKHNTYKNKWCNYYFWRTHDQQEIDFIEETDGVLNAFEIKWNPSKKVKFSKTFLNAYLNTETHVINSTNYFEFLV